MIEKDNNEVLIDTLNPIVQRVIVIAHETSSKIESGYCCSCNDYCGCEGKTGGCDCELDGIED